MNLGTPERGGSQAPDESSEHPASDPFDEWLAGQLREISHDQDAPLGEVVDLKPELGARLERDARRLRRVTLRRRSLMAVAAAAVAFLGGVGARQWLQEPAGRSIADSADRRPVVSGTMVDARYAGSGADRLNAPAAGALDAVRVQVGELDRQLAELRALRSEGPMVRISSQSGVDYVVPLEELLELLATPPPETARTVW